MILYRNIILPHQYLCVWVHAHVHKMFATRVFYACLCMYNTINARCIICKTYYISSGALIGFVNTGSINTHLSNLEQLLEKGSGVFDQPLAQTMLVVMVRGLFSSLQFPYVQFPCGALRGDQMFHILWKTGGRLE